MRLDTKNHDRDSAGLRYVYPVVSRRAGGVSIGINLNPNNACNWRCVYCQVPGLVYGNAPEIDLGLLEHELRDFLREAIRGTWMESSVPQDARKLIDVAFSGNGEPTSSRQLAAAVEIVARVLAEFGPAGELKLVLITNGSLVHRADVQAALRLLASSRGEVWFKLDSATDAGQLRINNDRAGVARSREHLETAARLCPTWIQTLVFDRAGPSLDETGRRAYIELLRDLVAARVPVRGVLLYGLARPSHQPEASELSALPAAWLESFASEIRALGLEVKVSI